MKRLLVTGGAGFIGSNFVNFVEGRRPSWDVVVLDNFSTGSFRNLEGAKCEVIEGSVVDYPTVSKAVEGVDMVVHLAAIGSVPRSIQQPQASHDANITGTFNVLDAARSAGVSYVVVASSSSVYGGNPKNPRAEADLLMPLSPYAVTKLATEAYANAYRESFGLSTLAFRFFNVYGPRQRFDSPYAAVIPKFIFRALSGEPLEVFGTGTQSRDFTYVDTVSEALLAACDRSVSRPTPLNLAMGDETSINGLLEVLEGALGIGLEVTRTKPRIGDVLHSRADPTEFAEAFPGIRAHSLVEGILKTVAWARTEGLGDA